ncbi:MAG: zinc ribbon domain-containing protein [Oscillospiraceae bacterium]|nr:zinc ribbon domain-containing protein [Oscillospiraceae bacterium]
MFCSNCGKQIPDTAKFCPMCGTNFSDKPAPEVAAPAPAAPVMPANTIPVQPTPTVEAAVAAQQPVQPVAAPAVAAAPAPVAAKKPLPKGVLFGFIGGAALIVVALIVVLMIVVFSGGGSITGFGVFTDEYETVRTKDGLAIFHGAKNIDVVDIDSGDNEKLANPMHTAMYFITNDDVLYYVDGNNTAVEVAEDVSDACISVDGKTLAYVEEDKVLYIYRNGESEKVDELESKWSYYNTSFCLSPDGAILLYSKYEEEDGESICYFYKDGKSEKLGKNLSPITVSQNGTTTFVYDSEDHEICAYKDLSDKVESLSFSNSVTPSITMDLTQILYTDNDGDTYVYSIDMDSPVKVAGGRVTPIFPANSAGMPESFDRFLGIEDGKIRLYRRNGDAYEDERLISSFSSYQVSADGKTILYLEDGDIYKIKAEFGAEKQLVAEYAYSFKASADLNDIYFESYTGDLKYSSGDPKVTTMIADDDYDEYVVTPNGVCVIDYDGELGYSDNGGRITQVKKPAEVDDLDIIAGAVCVVEDDMIYVSADGISYTDTKLEID